MESVSTIAYRMVKPCNILRLDDEPQTGYPAMMRRLIVCLLIFSFSLPFISARGAHSLSSSPSLDLHTLLHEHAVEHHHNDHSHLYQLVDSDESERHLSDTIVTSHCTVLFSNGFHLPATAILNGRFDITSATIPADPDPDRLFRPPQA